MKNAKPIRLLISAALMITGAAGTVLTRAAAIAENASAASTMWLALSLIAAIAGLASCLAAFRTEQRETDIRTMVFAAMFAALSYIGFAYLKIDIPVGSSSTAFHLGNVFVVMGALFLGGYWGGMSGAIGLTIADLTTQYVTSAPKTFLLKLCIGLISGAVAHKIFRLNQEKERKVPLPVAVLISSAAGMGFNVVADPVVGYFYKQYVLGVPQEMAKVWAKIGALTTLVNAVIAVIVATLLYLALRKPMARIGALSR